MKAENKTTSHNRTIRLSEIPMPAEETAGASPLCTELEITVNYTQPRDGRNGQRGVTLDKYAIPALLAAINGDRDDVGAEILFRSASNYEPHYKQIVTCVKALRHIIDGEAERVAIANAEFANDPAAEDYDRMHQPAAEQYPRESRDAAIVDLVRHFLNELKPEPANIILEPVTECQRCGSAIQNGFCADETCPFSDHRQSCPAGWTGHPEHAAGACNCAKSRRTV